MDNKNNWISFPPTETVKLTDEQVKELLKEGMEIRKSIEKTADRTICRVTALTNRVRFR